MSRDFQGQAPFNAMELDQQWNLWRCIAKRASRKRVIDENRVGVYTPSTLTKVEFQTNQRALYASIHFHIKGNIIRVIL